MECKHICTKPSICRFLILRDKFTFIFNTIFLHNMGLGLGNLLFQCCPEVKCCSHAYFSSILFCKCKCSCIECENCQILNPQICKCLCRMDELGNNSLKSLYSSDKNEVFEVFIEKKKPKDFNWTHLDLFNCNFNTYIFWST